MTEQEFFDIWHGTFNKDYLAGFMNENAHHAEALSKEKNIGVWDAWDIILNDEMKDVRQDSILKG